ncbi:MAG: helix-turn-helix transcriptional regulator [Fimbriimonadaceae bacterium]|nr:helix-turn-helix transcriptional regulator [Chitinophagales bacterium]
MCWDMEMNELVKRTVYDTRPVTVEYELTSYGKSLEKVIDELRNWGTINRKRILRKFLDLLVGKPATVELGFNTIF